MPYDFHNDLDAYFDQQRQNAQASILPFVERHVDLVAGSRVLEIGCHAGGVLKPFAERGAHVTGVDLRGNSVEYARERFGAEHDASLWRFDIQDIYEIEPSDFGAPFDLIVLKDTIEHIHNQRRLFEHMARFLAPSGKAFFAFPPWQMPFGGHQQGCEHPALMRLPYFHLLPASAYEWVLRRFGEPSDTVDELLDIKRTGISIERFERTATETGYRVAERKLYLVNPIYQYRYGIPPREQMRAIAAVPVLRSFLTTSAYYLLARD